jgi:hypothetical protein
MAKETNDRVENLKNVYSSLRHLQQAFHVTSMTRDMLNGFTVENGPVEQVTALGDEVVAHFDAIDEATLVVPELYTLPERFTGFDVSGSRNYCRAIEERAHLLYEKTGDLLAAYEIDRIRSAQ